MNPPTSRSMAVASSEKRSGSMSACAVVAVCSVMAGRSLRGFEAGEVVADEVLQGDRHLLPIEGRLRVVVEEVEDRCVRHHAVVVEADAGAGPGLVGPSVAAAAGDEVRIAGPPEALEVGEDAALVIGLRALVALR